MSKRHFYAHSVSFFCWKANLTESNCFAGREKKYSAGNVPRHPQRVKTSGRDVLAQRVLLPGTEAESALHDALVSYWVSCWIILRPFYFILFIYLFFF